MPELQKIPTGKFNPGYGCAIMVIMVLTFSGIVTWIVHSLLEQNRQIAGFTVEQADPLPELKITDEQKSALRARLQQFADEAAKGEETSLSLSVADCNVLFGVATDVGIGGDKDSTPYPEVLRVTGFDAVARRVKTDLRLPMNKLPWQEGHRYLVGSATFKPDIENGSFVIRVDAVAVPGKEVPEGFVRNLKNWDWLDVAKKKIAAMMDTLKKVTAWRIADDGSALIMECSKAAAAATAKP